MIYYDSRLPPVDTLTSPNTPTSAHDVMRAVGLQLLSTGSCFTESADDVMAERRAVISKYCQLAL